MLRVYSNNMENLVRNDANGACTQIPALDHLASMLVDDSGNTGTSGVESPDLVILQQVRDSSQADSYADELSARFGYAAGTYRAIVAWDEPAGWGYNHDCRDRSLGDLKRAQTNGIIYNSRTLSLANTSKYWSTGWLKPGASYNDGAGCIAYEPPNVDTDPARAEKWQRTSAIAARFTIKGTSKSVFAATMHLPRQNKTHPCAGDGDAGVRGTGIRLSPQAARLMEKSVIRVIGVDANRTGIDPDALTTYAMSGLGTAATMNRRKIDYLFVRGAVQASSIDHTVAGTKSNHRALYGFINY